MMSFERQVRLKNAEKCARESPAVLDSGLPFAESSLRIRGTDAAHIDDVLLPKSRDPFEREQVSVDRAELHITQQDGIVLAQEVFKERVFDDCRRGPGRS